MRAWSFPFLVAVACGPSDGGVGSTTSGDTTPADSDGTGSDPTTTSITASGPNPTASGESTATPGDETTTGDDAPPGDGSSTGGPGDDPCVALASQRECLAWMENGALPDTACAWAEIQAFGGGGGIECPHAHVGRCIPIAYQGDGCGIPFTCDLAEPGPEQVIFFRELDESVEVFVTVTPTLCEYQPVDFSPCAWPEPTGGPIPPPRFGVPECNCLCEEL